jgi:hypothetical protein
MHYTRQALLMDDSCFKRQIRIRKRAKSIVDDDDSLSSSDSDMNVPKVDHNKKMQEEQAN